MLFMREINISSQWHHNTKPTVAPLPANERWSFETHSSTAQNLQLTPSRPTHFLKKTPNAHINVHYPDGCTRNLTWSSIIANSSRTILARVRRHWLPPVSRLVSKANPHSVSPACFIINMPPSQASGYLLSLSLKHLVHTCTLKP